MPHLVIDRSSSIEQELAKIDSLSLEDVGKYREALFHDFQDIRLLAIKGKVERHFVLARYQVTAFAYDRFSKLFAELNK